MLSPGGDSSLNDIFAHIDTFVQSLGPETVGIGSDFLGFEHPARGMEDISQLPHLVEVLARHGYDESSVRAILGGNWVRLYKEILAEP
jgi:membrane dipeptidase